MAKQSQPKLTVKLTGFFYGVIFQKEHDGTWTFAVGQQAGPVLFYNRVGALHFRDALKAGTGIKGKVRKIGATFNTLA